MNKEGRGERLFDADGERTQYIEGILNFSREYQIHFQRTRAFCARLKELELLEPMQAQFSVAGQQPRSLGGFMAVNREKLKALDDEVLVGMARRDELELIYAHLHSMQHFSNMLERTGAAAQPPADDAPAALEEDETEPAT